MNAKSAKSISKTNPNATIATRMNFIFSASNAMSIYVMIVTKIIINEVIRNSMHVLKHSNVKRKLSLYVAKSILIRSYVGSARLAATLFVNIVVIAMVHIINMF